MQTSGGEGKSSVKVKAKVNMATKRQTMFPSRCEWEVVNCINTARIVSRQTRLMQKILATSA